GAFIGLGLLIMVKNLIDKRLAERRAASSSYVEEATGVTG
ncbi:MAG: electron transport complex subunit RsxE, partial [Candidatus Thiodiazotropha taylori]|nr:electron transport complex subunit RsxE [Candidatus Thiodiazotropha taylori]MCW4232316.1 electron transport complex subunit RsxE [Candidatus Thiodiazotropha taylori]